MRQKLSLFAVLVVIAFCSMQLRASEEPTKDVPPPVVSLGAVPGAEPEGLEPPKAPAHAQRDLNTAAVLVRDLHEVVVFLEQGKAYFRAYQKSNHTPEENAKFLRFLETHEKEREIAKKEAEALKRWVFEKSGLED
jgi:hypothetical protein